MSEELTSMLYVMGLYLFAAIAMTVVGTLATL